MLRGLFWACNTVLSAMPVPVCDCFKLLMGGSRGSRLLRPKPVDTRTQLFGDLSATGVGHRLPAHIADDAEKLVKPCFHTNQQANCPDVEAMFAIACQIETLSSAAPDRVEMGLDSQRGGISTLPAAIVDATDS